MWVCHTFKLWCCYFKTYLTLCVGIFNICVDTPLFIYEKPSCYHFFAEKIHTKEVINLCTIFITDLFNIDKKMIKKIEVISSKDLTEFHISLVSEKLRCPYCHGITHLHGFSKPKVINHPKLTDRKCIIVFKNNRYQCNECLRTFSGKNPFTFSNFKNSFLSMNNIMKSLSNLNYTYSMVAELTIYLLLRYSTILTVLSTSQKFVFLNLSVLMRYILKWPKS